MKFSFLAKYFLGLMAIMALTFTSCNEDDGGPGDTAIPPFVQLLADAGFISSDATINLGETIKVKVQADKGDNPLKSIEILETAPGGTENKVDLSRLVYNGVPSSSNPALLFAPDTEGLTWEIEITAQTELDTPYTYTFLVTDDADNTDMISIDVTVADPGTPIDGEATAIIFANADGPNPDGGVDFRNGSGDVEVVSALSAEADLIDSGIDLAQPAETNWKQTMEPANGATMKYVDPNVVENFSYASVSTKEEIQAIWDASVSVAVTPTVLVGDSYIINKGNDYFLIYVDEVNVTMADNLDNYSISVKQSLDN